jgi:hypothetical protein
MRALTPRRLARADKASRFLCFAVRTSRPQPRHGPGHHHLIHVGVTGRVLSPRLRQGIANSPNHNAETGSLSCGLLVHFRLLPTPPPADTHSRTTQLPSATCGVTSHGLDFHLLTKQHRRRTIPGARPLAKRPTASPRNDSAYDSNFEIALLDLIATNFQGQVPKSDVLPARSAVNMAAARHRSGNRIDVMSY